MNKYEFKIDKNGLYCIKNNIRLSESISVDVLEYITSNLDNKFSSLGSKILINGDGYQAIINDPVKILSTKYREKVYFSIENMEDIIKRMQKNIKKTITNYKYNMKKTTAIVAPLVLAATLQTFNGNIDTLDNNLMEPISQEDIISSEEVNQEIVIPISADKDAVIDNSENIENTNDDIKIEQFEEEKNDLPCASLRIDDRSLEYDVVEIQNKYKDYCEKAGKKWGISPSILLGLLTQESHGNHINLTQIEFKAFRDQELRVYDYESNEWKKVVFTSNPANHPKANITINEEEFKNPYTNIAASAIILNYAANLLKTDNVFSILEYYNKGHGNFYKNIRSMEANTGVTLREVLDNPVDTELLNYSYVCDAGDPNYINNVMQYIPGAESGQIYYYRMEDGNKKKVSINVDRILSNNKTR